MAEDQLERETLLCANRHFHRLLVAGVPVQYQFGGETRGGFVRLIERVKRLKPRRITT